MIDCRNIWNQTKDKEQDIQYIYIYSLIHNVKAIFFIDKTSAS